MAERERQDAQDQARGGSYRAPPGLFRWLGAWPSRCRFCPAWGFGPLCRACEARHGGAAGAAEPRCGRCALPVPTGVSTCATCSREPPPFSAALAAVDYEDPWREPIRQLKYAGDLSAAPLLARTLLRAVLAHPARRGIEVEMAPTLLLPMPLSPDRLRERGFNQSWEIARRVARRLGHPASPTVLRRLVDLPAQAGLGRAERLERLRGVFDVAPTALPQVRGSRIALVDDVLTTGATAAEATRTLLAAGAAEVQVWVVARTPAPEPDN